ncbi:phosphate-starvation-inducible PsiE family protein [Nitrospina watsonii]|uniref:Globin-sensor domain-containing protein n=1 Tax=Nitrospina watsonii TaxID=1323948 RepID=A0ABM9HAA4_9BACT|nr:protoglobin domain-containing protein [Nitrospina watsonii]CAI2717051.1 conserved membrane protein of unknown function [Nitrospina watsonii]
MDLTKDTPAAFKSNYDFTETDEKLLSGMKSEMQPCVDEFLDGFYAHVWKFGRAHEFLKNDATLKRHRSQVRQWYMALFDGNYDMAYFQKLYKAGAVHVKLGLPTHYVNAAFNYVRLFTTERIQRFYADDADREPRRVAMERILDINLDVLSSSYREGELGRYLSLSPLEKALLGFLKKISSYFNYVLAGALVMVAFAAIGLFGYDVYLLASGQTTIEAGILTTLGSLLILWAAIELIHEEIKRLQGGSFALQAFIALAIAAIIRKILILSLSTTNTQEVMMYGVLVLCLGLAYWLIVTKSKTQETGPRVELS